jgi:porin
VRYVGKNIYNAIFTTLIIFNMNQSIASGNDEFAFSDDDQVTQDEKVLKSLEMDVNAIPYTARDEFTENDELVDDSSSDDFNANSGTYRVRALNRFPNTPRETSTEKWLKGNQALGNWFGVRSELEGRGVDINGQYTFAYLANVDGGIGRGGGYDDQLQFGVDTNFGRLFKSSALIDTQFTFDFIHTYGSDDSANYVGNIFTVSQAFVDQGMYLDEVYLLQGLHNREYWFKIGRLDAGNDFLVSDLYCVFVNSGFCGNPSAITFNGPWSTPPNAQWGVLLGASPVDEFVAKLGVYNTNLNTFEPNNIGGQFSFNNSQGANIMASISYLRNQGEGDAGLSGRYTLGGIYFTGRQNNDDFTADPNGAPGNRLGGIYFEIEQEIFAEAGSSTGQGLSSFVTGQAYTGWDVTLMPLFFNGGLVYTGIFDARPEDQLALGAIYGRFGEDAIEYQGASFGYEAVIELTYRFNFTNWFFLQPDLQYVIHPFGGSADLSNDQGITPKNAFVIGIQGGFNL